MKSQYPKILALFTCLLAFPVSGTGAPSVSGNTLTWPADGWYQVQRADTYATVCEGVMSADAGLDGGPCLLDSGRYIVINHSSGERFENVVVEAASNSANSVMVNGNIISWPDDGWYQVQDADTYETACDGGRECSVQPGIFTVINHTTGERFTDIRVGLESDAGEPDEAEPEEAELGTVQNNPDGQLISWPDDGWYQVQNAIDYTTVCEGGRECQVGPGSYYVINHSSGERRFVEVGVDDVPGSATVAVRFDITVPAFMSDELQVRLQWGEQVLDAAWVVDESWFIAADFPSNTELRLMITFSDRNGELILGSYEAQWASGSLEIQTVSIAADQFDTARWDSDGDGVSNLDESLAASDPFVADGAELATDTRPPELIYAALDLVTDKTFRIRWQESINVQFYRVLENPDGVSGYTPISPDLARQVQVFDHRVPLYTRTNARYVVQACNTNGCVDSNELIVSGALEQAIGYFKASNTGSEVDEFGRIVGDQFGGEVSLSADGNTLVVGAVAEGSASSGINGNQADNSANGAGAVYVFSRENDRWQQQAYLKASNAERGDRFGEAVQISDDGTTVVVGAPGEDSGSAGVNGNQSDNTEHSSGAVYVFVRDGADWQQQAYLKGTHPDGDSVADADEFGYGGDWFGAALTISADGNTLAVGAPSEDGGSFGIDGDPADNSVHQSGAVVVFERVAGSWQQQAYLKNNAYTINFGASISISADGNTLAVGKTSETVLVFKRASGAWRQQAIIEDPNTTALNYFGVAVSLSGDGQTLAIAGRSQTVYLFKRIGDSWQLQMFVRASNKESSDHFGGGFFSTTTVSLSFNGDTLAVGAFEEASGATGLNGDQSDNSFPESGAAYLFVLVDGSWQQQSYIKAPLSQGFLFFGRSLDLSADGQSLAIGATGEDSIATGINGDQFDYSAPRAGAVYLY